MIMPTIRASLSRRDARQLVALIIARGDPGNMAGCSTSSRRARVDSLLDDPRVLNGLLTDPEVSVPPPSSFTSWFGRHSWKAASTTVARPTTSPRSSLRFGRARRGVSDLRPGRQRIPLPRGYCLGDADCRRTTAVPPTDAHGGLRSLDVGLFPDYLEERSRRRGAPPIAYSRSWAPTATGWRPRAERRRSSA